MTSPEDRRPDRAADSASEAGAERSLQFPQAIIDRALGEGSKDNFLAEELAFLLIPPGTGLADYHRSLLRKSKSAVFHPIATTAGFDLAYRVLRYAADESGLTLPVVTSGFIRAYEQRIIVPGTLRGDFQRDYERHETITKMVDKLKHPSAQAGARMMFSLFGRMANPTRAPIPLAGGLSI